MAAMRQWEAGVGDGDGDGAAAAAGVRRVDEGAAAGAMGRVGVAGKGGDVAEAARRMQHAAAVGWARAHILRRTAAR